MSLRKIAERIAKVTLDPWHVEPEYVAGVAEMIEKALRDRDERAAKIAETSTTTWK